MRLLKNIEKSYSKLAKEDDKRQIGYEILELKTDLKLASLTI
jgi:hypothetical protein